MATPTAEIQAPAAVAADVFNRRVRDMAKRFADEAGSLNDQASMIFTSNESSRRKMGMRRPLETRIFKLTSAFARGLAAQVRELEKTDPGADPMALIAAQVKGIPYGFQGPPYGESTLDPEKITKLVKEELSRQESLRVGKFLRAKGSIG